MIKSVPASIIHASCVRDPFSAALHLCALLKLKMYAGLVTVLPSRAGWRMRHSTSSWEQPRAHVTMHVSPLAPLAFVLRDVGKPSDSSHSVTALTASAVVTYTR